MERQKTTKKALLTSLLSLVLCFAMLIGTTFAWFTDSVTSGNNRIVAGDLKLDLKLLDKTSNQWNSVKSSKKAIFNYDKWEPGYTDVKILKIENEGSLALKWTATFKSDEALGTLADVIDVFVKEDVTTYPTDRGDLVGWKKAGTIREFVTNIKTTTYGDLKAGQAETLGIALKMRESAGNEYKNAKLGFFDIIIYATQLNSESDSFGPDYDKGLDPLTQIQPESLPEAEVTELPQAERTITFDLGGATTSTVLPVGLNFEAPDENLVGKEYEDWNVDFVVKFSQDVKANQVVFLGYHKNVDGWLPLPLTRDLKAGEEIRVMTELFAPALKSYANIDITPPANAGLGYSWVEGYFSPFKCGVIATTDFIAQNKTDVITEDILATEIGKGFHGLGFDNINENTYVGVQNLPLGTEVTLELRMYEAVEDSAVWAFGGIETGTSYLLESFTYILE